MRHTSTKLAVMTAVMAAGQVFGAVLFDNGEYPITSEYNDYVWVGYLTPIAETTVILLPGGAVTGGFNMDGYNYSRIILDGGTVSGNLNAHGHCQITLNSGSVLNQLEARDNAVVNLYGGTIGGNIQLMDNAELIIYGIGCRAGEDVYEPGQGISLPSGITAVSVIFAEGAEPVIYNVNLPDGSYAAISLLIPEPATLGLLAVGGLLLRRRKNT